MTTPSPRYRPAHQTQRTGKVFIMNTGMTRLREGDWAIILPDGTRQPWAGRKAKGTGT